MNRDALERAKALLKAHKEAQENEVIKTSETPQPMKPIDRARALNRKIDNQYQSHIAKKLLPSLQDK